MNIVAGSYEKYIMGWRFKMKKPNTTQEQQDEEEEDNDQERRGVWLNPTFTYPAHTAPVKCLAMAGPFLVTGGMDDVIKIFDIAAYCEVGSLLRHTAAITTLSFYGQSEGNISYPTNLLSGSLDGTIGIWDADTWVHLKTMRAHKRGVNDLTIHPSGRLALSVGRDCHLSMFNLIKGRCTFNSNLGKEATLIEFNSRIGDSYSVGIDDVVSVHNAEDSKLLYSLQHDNRVHCIAPAENGLLLTGGEDSAIRAWDLSSGKVAFSMENAHKSRIKGLAVLGSKAGIESRETPYLVASASSDGFVRVWDVRIVKKENPTPLKETDSRARITCLAASNSCDHMKSLYKETLSKIRTSTQQTRIEESPPKENSQPALTTKMEIKNGLGIKSKKGTKRKGT